VIGNILAGTYEGGPIAGDFESIATVSVGSGGSTEITFSSIPSTFQHLQIRGIARSNLAANAYSLAIRFNGDTSSVYARHNLLGNGTSASAAAEINVGLAYSLYTMGTTPSNIFAANVVDVLDYKDTNKFKTVRALSGGDTNGTGTVALSSGLWRSANAITSITLTTGGFGDLLQYSHFALYGIKG
jgi:hypothetical protein